MLTITIPIRRLKRMFINNVTAKITSTFALASVSLFSVAFLYDIALRIFTLTPATVKVQSFTIENFYLHELTYSIVMGLLAAFLHLLWIFAQFLWSFIPKDIIRIKLN